MSLQTINFDRLQLKPNDRLLDLGCGEGRHAISAYLVEDLDAVGVDLSIKDLQTTLERFNQFMEPDESGEPCQAKTDNLKKSLVLSVADGMRLPFRDESFDKVICSEVLEHIPDYYSVIAEIHRVVKQGGILAVSVPRFFPEWVCWQLSAAYHQVKGGHIRIFTARRLRENVESNGFIFSGKHHAHALHVPYWWMKCLFWRNDGEPEARVVAWYHRFLTWDLMQQPRFTRILDKCFNPMMGKSIVMYFIKTVTRPGTTL